MGPSGDEPNAGELFRPSHPKKMGSSEKFSGGGDPSGGLEPRADEPLNYYQIMALASIVFNGVVKASLRPQSIFLTTSLWIYGNETT